MNHYLNTPEFLSAFKQGDQIAFREFFDATIKNTIRIVFLKCGWATVEEIEDFVSIAYCKVYERRTAYNEYGHIIASLINIAVNEANSYAKHRIKQKKWEKSWAFITGSYGYDNPIEQQSDKMDEVAKAIPQLSRLKRTIFELSFYKLKTIGEISVILGISMQTVRNHRQLAIDGIRKILLVNDYKSTGKYVTMHDNQKVAAKKSRISSI